MSRTPVSITLILLMTALLPSGDIGASTVSSGSTNAEATRESIEQLEHRFNEAILSQDRAALKRLLSDDYTSGGSQVLTKSELIDQIVTVIPPKTQTIDSMSVKLYGDTAVVTGLATAEWLSPEGAGTKSFRWVNVWVHGMNGWRIVFGQSTIVALDSSMDGC
ncbi:nuclear transport factor 2 family protein [bacterium]|nr:nuclear transport factor 2 family protein [bacterium]